MLLAQVALPPTRLARHARAIGLLALVIGAALCWFFALLPLQEAQAGAAHIHFQMKVFLVGPMAIAFGLMLLVGGGRVGEAFSGPPRTRAQHLLVWPPLVLSMVAGGIAFWWFEGQLSALGYVTG